jgi:photosystem II stability/assembly factor-like uncharacterized protein
MNKLFASQLLATVALSGCFLLDPGGGAAGASGDGGGGGKQDAAPSSGDGGGATPGSGRWQAADDPVCGASISQISFVDDLHGYLLISDELPAGTQSVYYTDDGGKTWRPREIGNNHGLRAV